EDGIRDKLVTGVQTCALPILVPVGCTAFTVALWVNAATPSHPWQGLLTQWDLTLGRGLGLLISHEHRVGLRLGGDGGADIALDMDDVLWPNVWTFVAVTVDRTAG